MRIAFVGKGGSGKTTLAALFAEWLHVQGEQVLAIDADINQHLRAALGCTVEIPKLSEKGSFIKEYVRGTNLRITNPAEIIKTTPPGTGSNFFRLSEQSSTLNEISYLHNGLRIMETGTFTDDDIGVHCYHSKTGYVELVLNHTIDTKNEFIIVDMTAGADAFASGLFTRFDMTFIVVEPTLKSLSVYKQYIHHAQEFGIPYTVIGNKIGDDEDTTYISSNTKGTSVFFPNSHFVRNRERGNEVSITNLPEKEVLILNEMKIITRAQKRDWAKYVRDGIEFHKRNALSWANTSYGKDLTTQIDPNFSYPV